MPVSMLAKIVAVFATGMLASLSPCVYPILPITLGFIGTQSGAGKKTKILLYALGQVITLVGLGLGAVYLGETLGFFSQSRGIRIAMGVFLLVAALVSFMGRMPGFFSRFNQLSMRIGSHKPQGAVGAFLLGIGSALLLSPCTSPILGGVLAMMATSTTAIQGVLLMLFYSLGFTSLFVALGIGLLKVSAMPRAGKWMIYAQWAGSGLLVLAGLYYLVM